MFSIYIHNQFIFRGTELMCQDYYDNYIYNTFDELYYEIREDEDL